MKNIKILSLIFAELFLINFVDSYTKSTDYYWCQETIGWYSAFSASSWLPTREPSKARLDEHTAWTARNAIIGEYLEIDFKSVKNITSIVTQGREDSREFVLSYSLRFSHNGQLFSDVKGHDGSIWAFDGNTDGNSKKENIFRTPIIARYLRILPLRWGERISMRAEVYGCKYDRVTVSFNGDALLALDYRRVPIMSYEDNIRFRFKTVEPDGILLYGRGSQGDYLALQLIQNRMVLNLNLGSRRMTSLSVGSLLDDNAWHDVEIVRRKANVSLIVDRVQLSDQVIGDFTRLDINKFVYVGGVPNLQTGLKARLNFTGCMENLFINGTSSFTKWKQRGGGYYYGEPEYKGHNVAHDCPFGPSSHLTVSFNKPGSYLRYPSREADAVVNVSLEFRTYEEDATLLYHKFSGDGYFKLFLDDGKIKVEIKTIDTPGRIVLDNFDVTFNDGRWHATRFFVGRNKMELVVDDIIMKTSRIIDISAGRYFYIGGFGKDEHDLPNFVGCMRYISTSGFARRPKDDEIFPDKESILLAACQLFDKCNPNPCEHGGKCKQNSYEFFCDCEETGYTGSVCHTSLNPVSCRAYGERHFGTKRAQVTLDVDGSGYLAPFPVTCEFFNDGRVETTLNHKQTSLTPVDGYEDRGSFVQDIRYDASREQIEVFLNRSTHCKQRLHFECTRAKLFNTPYIDMKTEFVPNTWWMSRRNQMMDYWGGSLPGSRKCECGLMGNCITKEHWCNCDSGLDAILYDTGDLTVKDHLPVMQVRVGGTGKMLDGRRAKFSVGPLICEGDNIFDNVVTFRKLDATIDLPPFDMGISGDIFFEFRTSQRDGCMIYGDGDHEDFIKVCIVGGLSLQFQYEAGSGPQSVTVTTANVLNDDTWHSVLVERNRKGGSLTIDHSTRAETLEQAGPTRALDLKNRFIVGAAKDYRDGFVGCIRALFLNGVPQDLRGRVEREHLYGIGPDCIGKCASTPCMNNGTCYEGYADYQCDCRFTAFKGPICADQIGIKMLADTMIRYDLPGTYKSTVAEDIRVGFTTTDPRGFLIALRSNITGEYLTLAVSNSGHLRVTFDFGFERYEQVYGKRTFHEGQNHNVRLSRSDGGRTLTMQVDNYEPMSWTYPVRASDDSQFDNIQYLYIGKNESMTEGFRGCISQVSFDDIYPLKLLFQQDKPKNIKVLSSTPAIEDYCGLEPIRYAEEIIEARPALNISEAAIRDLYPIDVATVLGAIFALVLLALIIMILIISRYVARHKGDYQTHEAEGADLAPDADWAVQHSKTGPQVKKNAEMYI